MTFQSLLHQGISLLDRRIQQVFARIEGVVSIPSSSGHQFTGHRVHSLHGDRIMVSIPSSSGHQFTARAYQGHGPERGLSFQSLLHQGISLLFSCCRSWRGTTAGVSIPSSSGHQFTEYSSSFRYAVVEGGFNPFFIRASVYWQSQVAEIETPQDVSIPSSSGHQFTARFPGFTTQIRTAMLPNPTNNPKSSTDNTIMVDLRYLNLQCP